MILFKNNIFKKIYYILFLIFTTNYFFLNAKEVSNKTSFAFYFFEDKEQLERELKLADSLFKSGNYQESLKKSLSLLNKTEKLKDKKLEYDCLFLIGGIFSAIKDSEKSLFYYKKTYNLRHEKFFTNDHLAKSLLKIGAIYQKLEDNEKAKMYLEKILKIKEETQIVLIAKSTAYSNLAGIYLKESDSAIAKKYIYQSIGILSLPSVSETFDNSMKLSTAYGNLANIYLEGNQLEKAKSHYFQSLGYLKGYDDMNSARLKEVCYFNIAWVLYLQKDYKAYKYLSTSFEIKDSIYEDDIRKILSEVEAKHNVAIVKQVETLKRKEAQSNTWFVGIIGLLISILLWYFMNAYKLKQKNLSLELEQNKLLQEQNIEKIRSDAHEKILNAALDGKESERKQIAEILHDNVSALLSSANMHLLATHKHFNKVPEELTKSQLIITEAAKQIRNLSHELVSSILLKFGLEYAIKDLASKCSNSEIKLEAKFEGVQRYKQSYEIKVYNIVNELINNVLKHSKATNAFIRMKENEGCLDVLILDNGKGFNVEDLNRKSGIGLNQIKARVKVMDGVFSIKSSEEGTKVSLSIPIVKFES